MKGMGPICMGDGEATTRQTRLTTEKEQMRLETHQLNSESTKSHQVRDLNCQAARKELPQWAAT